ncbi:hypothetical protein OGM63_07950 [Plectonema radiosum NIES-515]|uniref:Uncharacterized protein n=1 Tax=Plectonema radiosum NIES-515 TaxID=2986073 RepID=A0ABT3AWQ6_9CYAN|nr:hypothetical protein [Plectonema radiosum]MCV3213460.1 hypothetical protein [Plectonema radiosum NIES-515]
MQLKSSAIKTKSNSQVKSFVVSASALKSRTKVLTTLFKHQNSFNRLLVITSSIAAAIIGFGAECAEAQITIQSTGTLSGTIQLPKFNPNFNRVVTRVDTNSKGTYSRQGVPLYTSNYVKVQTRADGSLHYFVDFKGIPVVSFDGLLTSPALSNGSLTSYNYQGKLPGTKFEAVVQDEFGLKKALYTGIVTDPKTGQKYQGTFRVTGQGPRYSQSNGSATPTVFDFKSDIPGKPTVNSLKVTNAPLIKLFITIPAGATPITPRSDAGAGTPIAAAGGGTPIMTAGTPIITAGGGIPIMTAGTPIMTAGGGTPIAAGGGTPIDAGGTPIVTGGGIPIAAGGGTPIAAGGIPIAAGGGTPIDAGGGIPIDAGGGIPIAAGEIISPIQSAIATSSNSTKPSAEPNVEFSNGNSSALNPLSLASNICSRKDVNCTTKPSASKQTIGPRSRVLLR